MIDSIKNDHAPLGISIKCLIVEEEATFKLAGSMNPLPGVLCPMNGVAPEGAFEDDGLLWNIPCCCLCKLVSSPRRLCTPPDSLPGLESSEWSIGRPALCKGGSKCEGPGKVTFGKGGASETVAMLDEESLRLEAVESYESLLDLLYAMCTNKHRI